MSRSNVDSYVAWVLRIVGSLACLVVALIVAFVFVEAIPSLANVGHRFMVDDGWTPAESAANGRFGLIPIVVGSLAVTLGATMLAAPLAIISAIFCQYYAPRIIGGFYRRVIELLAGIPSVVFGFWGLVVLVPMIAMIRAPGASLLAGVLIVGLMILPTIALVTLDALARVPQPYWRGSAALGVSRFTFVSFIALPTARGSIASGLLLGVARALGETMAVVMVCGNVVKLPGSVFDPVRTLTANIALEMGYALGDHRSALFASGLILLIGIAVILIVIESIKSLTWKKSSAGAKLFSK